MRRSCHFISIHVPRVEADSQLGGGRQKGRDFNPRPPCGGRPKAPRSIDSVIVFQSTSPVWRTTPACSPRPRATRISIHVPRVEDDDFRMSRGRRCILFQSTSPVWRTTLRRRWRTRREKISIHVPRVEDDLDSTSLVRDAELFQSTSPVWRTT